MRLGIARSLCELDPELRGAAQALRPPHPRRPREGVQEVRPEEGPQGAAVLQAVATVRSGAGPLRHRRRPRGRQRGADRRAGAGPRPRRGPGPARPDLRGRPRHPPFGPAAPGRLLGRPGRRGRRRRRPRRAAHPRRGRGGRAARGARRRDLGLAQPLRRQRHQAVQPARDEAARRGRGRDRARARRAPGRPATARRAARPATGWGGSRADPGAADALPRAPGRRHRGPPPRRAARRASTAPTAPPATSRPACFAELGAAVTALHDAPDGANINDKCGSTDPAELAAPVVEHAGRPRPGLRRRRRPGHRGRPHRDASSTATCCWPCSRSTWPSGAGWPATPWPSRS